MRARRRSQAANPAPGPGRPASPRRSQGNVLIVGAGPTGLALACELIRRNVPCRIVEASATRSNRSKALAIWPRTLEILEGLGVVEAALNHGLPLRKGTIWSAGRRVAGFDLRGVNSRYRHALILPQFATEAILEGRLEQLGCHVERGVECLGVRDGNDGAIAVLRAGPDVEEARTDWIVGCDGPDSVVRRCAGIAMPQRLERQSWLLADVILETALEPDGVHYFLSRIGVLHMVPVPGSSDHQSWRITLSVGPDRPDEQDWPVDRLASVVANRAAVPVRIRETEWVSGFRVRQGLAREFRAASVLIAGDAAHIHSPAGGQGINVGLQDAANLGWKLAHACAGQVPDSLLGSYSAERRLAARAVVRATDRATRIGTMTNGVAVGARDLLWSFADRHGVIERRVAPALAGLGQRYPDLLGGRGGAGEAGRHVSAVALRLARGRPGAGARLPNIQVGQRWLWDEIPDTRSSVLALAPVSQPTLDLLARSLPAGTPLIVIEPGSHTTSRGWRSFADPQGRAGQALNIAPGTILVIRPDRYIGVSCRATRLTPIRRYFEAVGGTQTCHVPET
jgi:2-polyprenyl-6-methoxyphenol hydroxylase-like FAD-dependent oxidoreductase